MESIPRWIYPTTGIECTYIATMTGNFYNIFHISFYLAAMMDNINLNDDNVSSFIKRVACIQTSK